MKGKNGEKFYIVRADILPAAVKKTIKAKELIAEKKYKTVIETVAALNLSRSAFYKYKDAVFSKNDFPEDNDRQI